MKTTTLLASAIPSTTICLLLSICMLLMGCFTQSAITKAEAPPDDSIVLFHLLDGSYIKSSSGNHHRIDNGYQIAGEMVRGGIIQMQFQGVVHDNEIVKLSVERFNLAGTITLVGVAVGLGVLIVEASHWTFGVMH